MTFNQFKDVVDNFICQTGRQPVSLQLPPDSFDELLRDVMEICGPLEHPLDPPHLNYSIQGVQIIRNDSSIEYILG